MSVLALCKFTPLGFETVYGSVFYGLPCGVNLPRWGLKPLIPRPSSGMTASCKFTPLGFETNQILGAAEKMPV